MQTLTTGFPISSQQMSEFSHYRVHKDHQVPEMAAQEGVYETADPASAIAKSMRIEVTKLDSEAIEFDLVGVDAAIANALRRILLAEVATVAVETVWIACNTSIIQDEVLAHRIGLIPLKIDPSKLEDVVDGEETDRDTIVLHFEVECTTEIETRADGTQGYKGETAYSGALKWMAQGNQEEVFPEGIRPVHDDIVLAKMRPGQRIEFEAHCRRGLGKDHTKYSPVATAFYRLLPVVQLQKKIQGAEAQQLKSMCPMNVFDIEDLGGVPTAKVARPRDCSMCRECIRPDGWNEKVSLRRKANHYLFSVETVGSLAPEVIVREAIAILKAKAVKFRGLVDEYST